MTPEIVQLFEAIVKQANTDLEALVEPYDKGERDVLRKIAKTYKKRVRSVGIVPLLVAHFDNKANRETPLRGGIFALSPFWVDLDRATLLELAQEVEKVPEAWYPCMWFCHQYLKVDYLALVTRHGVIDGATSTARSTRGPGRVVLVPQTVQETTEFELIAMNGRDPVTFWRTLTLEA